MKNNQIIKIEDLQANLLPELQGWKEKQLALVKDNPFVEITDNKSYELAKKTRTALLKGRTEIEKSDKLIASKLREFRSDVSKASSELILISTTAERKQQDEVKRYEDEKTKEKAEKQRLEAVRVEKIKDSINKIYNDWKTEISEMEFKDIEHFAMIGILADADTSKFEEFELDFSEKVMQLKVILTEKSEQLQLTENQRLEDLRLKSEREAIEKEKAEIKKQSDADAKERKEAQDKIDAKNFKKQKALDKQQSDIDAEKKRLQEAENDRLAKVETERLKKEIEAKEKAQQKRIADLKPDVEKLTSIIEAIKISDEIPNLSDGKAKEFLTNIQLQIKELKSSLQLELKTIK
jgi:hypothetical protein